jgi:outer membrane protein
MRSRSTLDALVALAAAISTTASLSAQSPILTLEQAVNEALAKNDRTLTQHDVSEQSALGVRLARNTFQPKVVPNVLGSFGTTDINSQTYRVDVSQKFTTGTEVRFGIGTSTSQIPGFPVVLERDDIHFYNADTTLTLSQPLLRGFGSAVTRRSLTSAELRRDAATRQQTVTEQEVALEVASAYYRVVAQEAIVDVARKSLDRARRLRDASEAKLDAGLVSQLDVLRSQQLVSQAEIQLFDAQSATEDARDRLMFAMGRPPGEQFVVPAVIPRSTDRIEPDEAVGMAVANRLDLKSLVASATDAEQQVRYARNQLLPQMDVNFVFTRRETADSFAHSFGVDGFRFATFFNISTPVDRTPQLVDYQNALIDRDRRKRDTLTLQRRIADEVKRALRERDRLERTLIAADMSVEIGRREVEVAQERYERGLSNNLDVVTAESNLLTAESRRIAALADSALARLSLRAILGTLDPRKDVK